MSSIQSSVNYRALMIQCIIKAEHQMLSNQPFIKESFNLLYQIMDFDALSLEEIYSWYQDIFGNISPYKIFEEF
jgi:hypothetical protein